MTNFQILTAKNRKIAVQHFCACRRALRILSKKKEFVRMKATGIVRRIDDLGRVVIPKEIRRTMRIREGDPPLITLTPFEKFRIAVEKLSSRLGK